jgi:hypothetical protein
MKILRILSLVLGLAVLANAQTAVLSGTVYDANGSVIVNAKVTAFTQIDEKLQKIESNTNDEGVYKLDLPVKQNKETRIFIITKYVFIVYAQGFEKFEFKGFNFAPSSKGEMKLDFALNVGAFIEPIKVNSNKKKTKNKGKTINNK